MTSPPEHLNNAMLLQEKSALIYQTSRGPSLREVGAKLFWFIIPEFHVPAIDFILVTTVPPIGTVGKNYDRAITL